MAFPQILSNTFQTCVRLRHFKELYFYPHHRPLYLPCIKIFRLPWFSVSQRLDERQEGELVHGARRLDRPPLHFDSSERQRETDQERHAGTVPAGYHDYC
jgi:hypothetical protein